MDSERKTRNTQEKIIEVVRDFVKSGDSASVVARRQGVNYATMLGWLKRAGVQAARPSINWDKVREEALR